MSNKQLECGLKSEIEETEEYVSYGPVSLHEIFGDFVLYRNLDPPDRRLPRAPDLLKMAGLQGQKVPRKADPEFGSVVAAALRCARRMELPRGGIKRIVYLGDTKINDGTAFRNICAAGAWPGCLFIGADSAANAFGREESGSGCFTGPWAALPKFFRFIGGEGFVPDESMAVVIDIDKTAIGARGRNDHAINAARLEGLRQTAAGFLGAGFDPAAFHQAYSELDQPFYHLFTADNQDYVAYICLMLGAGLFELSSLVKRIRTGDFTRFEDLLAEVENRRDDLDGAGLRPVHDEVRERVLAGDPTAFKTFRHNEYRCTSARFGAPAGMPVKEILARRIVITQEVRQVAAEMRQAGVLIFGLSDKPDEAAFPHPAQAAAGLRPLHQLATVAIGSAGNFLDCLRQSV